MKKRYLLLLALLFFPLLTSAFQPRIIDQAIVVKVENPSVAQLFYGELTGSSALYTIELKEKQELHIELLVPKIKDIDMDVSAYLFKMVDRKEEIINRLSGKKHTWTEYYEELTANEYWQGPELTQTLEAGDYMVRVYSDDNAGKYVFAVGQEYEFTPASIVRAVVTMPGLKEFFGKQLWEAYLNVLGLYVAGFFVGVYIILMIVLKILKFIKKLFTRKKDDESSKTKPVVKLKSIEKLDSRQEKKIENKN